MGTPHSSLATAPLDSHSLELILEAVPVPGDITAR